jgi:Tfp pilus assembly protein PilZ
MNNPDRRRSARVEVLGQIQGRLVSLETPVTVREMSLGGMSIETPTAFEAGSTSDFLLTLGDGAGIEVAGKIVYSRPIDGAGKPRYLSGVQFVDQDDRDPHTSVGGLMTRIK